MLLLLLPLLLDAENGAPIFATTAEQGRMRVCCETMTRLTIPFSSLKFAGVCRPTWLANDTRRRRLKIYKFAA